MTAIYKLIDPRDTKKTPWYVGKTKNTSSRLRQHVHSSNRSVRVWISELKKLHLRPNLIVLRYVTGDWKRAERSAIKAARKLNPKLFNIRDGGEDSPPDNAIARLSNSMAGRIGIKVAQPKIRAYWKSPKASDDRSNAGRIGGRKTQLLYGRKIRRRLLRFCASGGAISGKKNTLAQRKQRAAALERLLLNRGNPHIKHPAMAHLVGTWSMHVRWHLNRKTVSSNCTHCNGARRPCSGQY